jgi:hypothetical protein
MEVEVFRTNVDQYVAAAGLLGEIEQALPGVAVNFDLEDCDKILRVVSACHIDETLISDLVRSAGYECQVL